MDDLVKRLREEAPCQEGDYDPNGADLMNEAADEIERLRAKVAQLQADRAQWVELPRLKLGKQDG